MDGGAPEKLARQWHITDNKRISFILIKSDTRCNKSQLLKNPVSNGK